MRAAMKRRTRDDTGSSLIAGFFMLVTMITAMGMSMDIMLGVYLKSSLADAVDVATHAAAGQIEVEHHDIDGDGADDTWTVSERSLEAANMSFYQVYARARNSYGGVSSCDTSSGCDFSGHLGPAGESYCEVRYDTDNVPYRLDCAVTDYINRLWAGFWRITDPTDNVQQIGLQASAVIREHGTIRMR